MQCWPVKSEWYQPGTLHQRSLQITKDQCKVVHICQLLLHIFCILLGPLGGPEFGGSTYEPTLHRSAAKCGPLRSRRAAGLQGCRVAFCGCNLDMFENVLLR